MSDLRVQPYAPGWDAAVAAFNRRLAAGRSEARLTVHGEASGGERSLFLVTEGEEVRGGFILNWQRFAVGGREERVAHLKWPVSEGLVDRRYARVGALLLRSALREAPLLYCLGMGGRDRPLPRMLQAMRWPLWDVPFLFRVVRARRLLRQLALLRQPPWRRRLARLAAWLPLLDAGAAAVHLGQRLRQGSRAAGRDLRLVALRTPFDGRIDRLWGELRQHHRIAAVRDAAALNGRYPAADPRHLRFLCHRDGALVGWLVLRCSALRAHPQFGDLRVGTLVDGCCRPDDTMALAALAARELRRRGAELLVSNQTHEAWVAGLLASGWISGPSNFLLAVSPRLAGLVGAAERLPDGLHVNRGDGDGPVHL
jgi:hypothetical protein